MSDLKVRPARRFRHTVIVRLKKLVTCGGPCMKRHPSLHPLSQHHHFALIQALEMRRAAEAPPEKRQATVERQAEKFVRFWHKTGHVHFREEEEVLLPAYARHARL